MPLKGLSSILADAPEIDVAQPALHLRLPIPPPLIVGEKSPSNSLAMIGYLRHSIKPLRGSGRTLTFAWLADNG